MHDGDADDASDDASKVNQATKEMLKKEVGVCNLSGLFGFADNSDVDSGNGAFEQIFESRDFVICNEPMRIRQFSWHSANANQIWPGTITLAEYLSQGRNHHLLSSGRVLELGSATGALAIYLLKRSALECDIVTSDIDDGGDVESNIRHNFAANGLPPRIHIPFTWGTSFEEARAGAERRLLLDNDSNNNDNYNNNNSNSGGGGFEISHIIASDILRYVSAFPALVQSLSTLFAPPYCARSFVMSWERRIDVSLFFALMADAGFVCSTEGRAAIYVFTRTS